MLAAERACPRPKRTYRLTPAGLEALRASAARNRPWAASTGPTTPAGKLRVRVNAMKSGERRSIVRADARETAALLLILGMLYAGELEVASGTMETT